MWAWLLHSEIRSLAEDILYADPIPTDLDNQVVQMIESLSIQAMEENNQKARQLLDLKNTLTKAGKSI